MAVRVVRAFALLLLGVYAGGVVFSVLSPSVFAMPGEAYVRLWQAQNHDFGRSMPVLLLTCLALMVVGAVLSVRRGTVVAGLAIAAAVLVAGTVVVTVTQMEPLNAVADAWDPDRLPAEWSATLQTWRSWHAVRIVLAVAAFCALLASQVLDTAGSRHVVRSEPAAV